MYIIYLQLPTNTGLLDLYAPDMVNDQSYDKVSDFMLHFCCFWCRVFRVSDYFYSFLM